MHNTKSPTVAEVWHVVGSLMVLLALLAVLAVVGGWVWIFHLDPGLSADPRITAPASPGQPPPAHR